MKSNNKLFKAGSLYFLGNIFDKAVAFITVPIFTRMLSTVDYGITTTYLSWVGILSVVITLSVGNSIRTAVMDFPDSKDEYTSSIFCLGLLSATIIVSIVLFTCILTNKAFFLHLGVLCCIHSFTNSIITAVQWRYMMDVKYFHRTFIQCVPNTLVVCLSIFLIRHSDSQKYWGRIYSYVLVFGFIACIYIIYYFLKGKTFFNKVYWRYALSFSLPIIFHSLSTVILSQSDRSMISVLYSIEEAGIYGLAYQFGMLPLVITTTFENIWIPWFTKKMEDLEYNHINNIAKPYISTVAVICSCIMMVAPEILKFMTVETYYSAVYMIAPVVAATFLMFLASISLTLEYYCKRTVTIAINTLIAAGTNMILNFIFIPKYGGVAAAYTTAISYGISFLMHYYIARKMNNELFPFKIYILPLTIIAFNTCFTVLCINLVILRWLIGITLCIVFLIFEYRFMKPKKGGSMHENSSICTSQTKQ